MSRMMLGTTPDDRQPRSRAAESQNSDLPASHERPIHAPHVAPLVFLACWPLSINIEALLILAVMTSLTPRLGAGTVSEIRHPYVHPYPAIASYNRRSN